MYEYPIPRSNLDPGSSGEQEKDRFELLYSLAKFSVYRGLDRKYAFEFTSCTIEALDSHDWDSDDGDIFGEELRKAFDTPQEITSQEAERIHDIISQAYEDARQEKLDEPDKNIRVLEPEEFESSFDKLDESRAL